MRNTFVTALKQTLVTEDSFAETFNQFLLLTEENRGGFRDQGKEQENEAIISMLGVGLGQLFEIKQVILNMVMTVYIKEEAMFHGSCFCNGHIVTFFYFSDLDRGMVSAAKFGTRRTHFIRIRSEKAHKEVLPKGGIHNN